MSALHTRWRRIAVVGLLAGGVVAGTALAAVPAEAAAVKNLVGNGSAESVSRQLPKGWTKGGSGSNTRVQTSVSGGAQAGRKFVRTKITKRRSGSAWWLTPVAPVKGRSSYTFSEHYRSGSPSVINAYFTVGRKVVGKKVASLPATGRWKAARFTVTAPAGATKVRFGHVLSAVGYVDVDNVSLVAAKAAGSPPATAPGSTPPVTAPSSKGLVTFTFDDGFTNQLTQAAPILKAAGNMPGTFYLISDALTWGGSYMNVSQAKQLQSAGHELGSHSVSHVNLDSATPATVTKELADSKAKLESAFGVGQITDLAYPFGAGNGKVQAEAAKYYQSARSTNPGLNKPGQIKKYSLTIGYVLNTTPLSTVQGWLDDAKANNTWLILCYHSIANDKPTDTYTLPVASFQSHVNAVKASGIKVVTVRQGLTLTGA
jgi:peptidoglycan/xylan/chitin deacetylase (PgdA/CDA1 family)